MLKRFGLGFAVGYVVGARSGRQGYEQLADAGHRLLEVPWVKDLVSSGEERARDAGERIVDAVRDFAGGGDHQSKSKTATAAIDETETTAVGTETTAIGTVTTAIGTASTGTETDELDDTVRARAETSTEAAPDDRRKQEHAADRADRGHEQRPRPRSGRGGGGHRPRERSRGGRDRDREDRDRDRDDRRRERSRGRGAKRSNLSRMASAALERGRAD